MKVVFLEDVPNVASAGEVKKVKDGYARNYLFPKKLAVLATTGEIAKLESRREANARRQSTMELEAEAFAQELAAVTVTLKVRAGTTNKIYGSVTNAAIAKELKRLTKHDIDKHSIHIEEPIKELGSHPVAIKLTKNVTATVTVVVEPKEEVEKEEKEKAEEKTDEKAAKKTARKAEAKAEEKEKQETGQDTGSEQDAAQE